jgi:SOS response regulatory protein OraA/RecX
MRELRSSGQARRILISHTCWEEDIRQVYDKVDQEDALRDAKDATRCLKDNKRGVVTRRLRSQLLERDVGLLVAMIPVLRTR